MNIRSEIETSESNDDISVIPVQDEVLREQTEMEVHQMKIRMSRFRMRHLFYIHLVIFITTGLFTGLIIYLIENNSSLKNRQMVVTYISAWFVSCTCAYGCGLTTLDFAKLSKVSQIILLVLTLISGIMISTLPAIIIKAYTHKHIEGITVDNDHGKEIRNSANRQQDSTARITNQSLSSALEKKLGLLPTTEQIRYWAYIIIIILILVICASIYLSYFVIIGAWLNTQYSKNKLMEGNSTVNPWYASIIIVITGFNQNGLTPFSDGMARFVDDVFMNIFVMLVRYSQIKNSDSGRSLIREFDSYCICESQKKNVYKRK
jgi:Trk-type K+ transport system membrane component